MNQQLSEQLDKILALADSSHEGEAVVAVRKAREILVRDGLNFSDLVRAATTNAAKSSGFFSRLSRHPEQLESQIYHLRQQLEDLRAQIQTQDLQVNFWRRRAMDLEQNAVRAKTETEKWKKIASDTADSLWDMGSSIGGEEALLNKSEVNS